MGKYRKKPVEIEAFEWTGGPDQTEDPQWIVDAMKLGENEVGGVWIADGNLHIMTLEGTMRADVGDFIIKGIAGEMYPCKPEIFHASYNEV
jgi:hypothetical protein